MYKTIKKLYIEPTTRCNLSCTKCFRHSWINESVGDIDLATFYRAIDDKAALKNTKTVFFGGMGEPLYHPNIIEMVEAVSKRGFNVELITNATLLSKDMSHALLNAGLNKLWVSMDGFSKESYEKFSIGSQFDLVYKNLCGFNDLRKQLPGHTADLGIAFVVMHSNLEQLKEIIPFAKNIRANDVNISNIIPSTPDDVKEMLYTDMMPLSARWKFSRKEKQSEKYRLHVSMPLMDIQRRDIMEGMLKILYPLSCDIQLGGHSLESMSRNCRFIAEGTIFVRWDGNVTPCMGLLHSSELYYFGEKRIVWHHSFGNIRETALHDIWNKQEYAEFRQRVMDFDFSPCMYCTGCYLRDENREDCYYNCEPTCGACIWAGGIVRCP